MRIFDDGFNEARTVRARFEMMKSFAHRPAVVAAFDDKIDFLPQILPDIAGPKIAGLAVPTESPEIAQAGSPDFFAHAVALRFGYERIVRWDAVFEGAAIASASRLCAGIDVNAQQLRE